jgi:hypothetical protein
MTKESALKAIMSRTNEEAVQPAAKLEEANLVAFLFDGMPELKEHEATTQLTARIPVSLHRRLRLFSVRYQVTLAEIVTRLLLHHLPPE